MNLEAEPEESLVEQKKKDPNTVFGILATIGAVIITLVFPSIFSFHTLCIYQVSYIKHNGGDAKVLYTMFYYPVNNIFQSIFGLFVGIIFAKVGVHWSNMLGTAIFVLAGFIMYISNRFYLDMISEALFGISMAILYYPSGLNACLYFMNHIGLINGILETASSVGTTVFTYIGEEMINPDKIPSDPIDNLYNKEIAQRVKTFIIIQIFGTLGSYIVEEIITKTYDENNKEKFSIKFLFKINEIKSLCRKKNDPNLIEQGRENIQSVVTESSDINKNQTDIDDTKIKKTRKEKIMMVLKSWKFWKYNLISLTSNPIGNIIFSLYRSIGEAHHVEQHILQLLGTLSFITQFIINFVFGVLCDYVNFSVLMFICNILGTIAGVLYFESLNYSIFFLILTLLLSVQSAAYSSLKDYHLMKVFGTDIYIDLTGVVNLSNGIIIIILTALVYFVEEIIEDKDSAYAVMFPLFGLVNFISVILGYFLDNEPFDYGE